MLVQQAIYTSVRGPQREGYQLIGTSPGVSEDQARALSTWCPSHDALLKERSLSSVNFHSLFGGSFCVSRTVVAGGEYSDRGAERLYTHCLITTPGVLARFANNPFALINAVAARGGLDPVENPPCSLEPLSLLGKASAVNVRQVDAMAAAIGARQVAALLDAVLTGRAVALLGGPSPDVVMEGLLNCLPVPLRAEFSLTSGLKHSPRRPFRLFVLPRGTTAQRRIERNGDVVVCDLDQAPPESVASHPWAHAVRAALSAGGAALLQHFLTQPQYEVHDEVKLDDLPQLAAQFQQSLPAAEATRPPRCAARSLDGPAPGDGGGSPVAKSRSAGPSQVLAAGSTATLAQFVALDEVLFDAIMGCDGALDSLIQLWPATLAGKDDRLVEQAREQYLSYAMQVWRQCATDASKADKAVTALDVLCVLFEE